MDTEIIRITKMEIRLTQDNMTKAVEFWLNEKVLREPCMITSMSESRVNESSTFVVHLEAMPTGAAAA